MTSWFCFFPLFSPFSGSRFRGNGVPWQIHPALPKAEEGGKSHEMLLEMLKTVHKAGNLWQFRSQHVLLEVSFPDGWNGSWFLLLHCTVCGCCFNPTHPHCWWLTYFWIYNDLYKHFWINIRWFTSHFFLLILSSFIADFSMHPYWHDHVFGVVTDLQGLAVHEAVGGCGVSRLSGPQLGFYRHTGAVLPGIVWQWLSIGRLWQWLANEVFLSPLSTLRTKIKHR